jgi:hypothetical protein
VSDVGALVNIVARVKIQDPRSLSSLPTRILCGAVEYHQRFALKPQDRPGVILTGAINEHCKLCHVISCHVMSPSSQCNVM